MHYRTIILALIEQRPRWHAEPCAAGRGRPEECLKRLDRHTHRRRQGGDDMKRALAPFLATILVASGVGYRPLYAQVGYTPSSIEWLTASSDVVAVASVADLAYKDRRPEPGETRSHWQWVTVTLEVRPTLKGKASETA